ncbi:hypothetical protein AB751O23_BC_00090, partial [Chlamydiales bacterium SCGC AB-751-O23]
TPNYSDICESLGEKLLEKGELKLLVKSLYSFSDSPNYSDICESLGEKLLEKGELELLVKSLYHFRSSPNYSDICESLGEKLLEKGELELLVKSLSSFSNSPNYSDICESLGEKLLEKGQYKLLLFNLFAFSKSSSSYPVICDNLAKELIKEEGAQSLLDNLSSFKKVPNYSDICDNLAKELIKEEGAQSLLEKFSRFSESLNYLDICDYFAKELLKEGEGKLLLDNLSSFSNSLNYSVICENLAEDLAKGGEEQLLFDSLDRFSKEGNYVKFFKDGALSNLIANNSPFYLEENFSKLINMGLLLEDAKTLVKKIAKEESFQGNVSLGTFLRGILSFSFSNLVKEVTAWSQVDDLDETETNNKIKKEQNDFLIELFNQFSIFKTINKEDELSLKEILDIGNPTQKQGWLSSWVDVRLPSVGAEERKIEFEDFLNVLSGNKVSVVGRNVAYLPLLFPVYSQLLNDKEEYSEEEFSIIKEEFFKVFRVLSNKDLANTVYKGQFYKAFSSLNSSQERYYSPIKLRGYNLITRIFKPFVEALENSDRENKESAEITKRKKKEKEKRFAERLNNLGDLEVKKLNALRSNIQKLGMEIKVLRVEEKKIKALDSKSIDKLDLINAEKERIAKKLKEVKGEESKFLEELGAVESSSLKLLEGDGLSETSSLSNKKCIENLFCSLAGLIEFSEESKREDGDLFYTLMQEFIDSDDKVFNISNKISSYLIRILDFNVDDTAKVKEQLDKMILNKLEGHLGGVINFFNLHKHREELKRFILSVLNETFNDDRYQGAHFEKLEELKSGLKDSWKEAALSKELTESINGQKCTIELAKDWRTIFLIGTEISGSCQNINATLGLNQHVLGYLLKGENRPLVIRNPAGEVTNRVMMRVHIAVTEEGVEYPVLMIDALYEKTGWELKSEQKLELRQAAQEVADGLGVKLLGEKDKGLKLRLMKTPGIDGYYSDNLTGVTSDSDKYTVFTYNPKKEVLREF